MGFASITKTRKPRQFNYVPRYYDERKERLQALIARAQEERGENRSIATELEHRE